MSIMNEKKFGREFETGMGFIMCQGSWNTSNVFIRSSNDNRPLAFPAFGWGLYTGRPLTILHR